MEYGWNFSISGLKFLMKSGLGKIFLKFLHALTMSFLLLNFDQKYKFSNKKNMVSAWRNFKKYKFSNKNNMVSAWRNFKNIFPRPLIIFRPETLKFHPYSILTGDTMVCQWKIRCLCQMFPKIVYWHPLTKKQLCPFIWS